MIKKGDVYYARLDPCIGSEQKGTRPIIVVQNDIGNEHSPTVVVTMITSSRTKRKLPTHVRINDDSSGLTKESIAMLEQLRTIDKQRLGELLGHVSEETMRKIEKAAMLSLGIRFRKGK